MKRIAHFVYDHSKLIIAFVIVVNIVSLVSFIRFDLDTDFLAFFTQGNEKAEAYTELTEKYESGESVSILIEDESSVLEKENLVEIFRLQQEIAGVEGVAQVQGVLPPQLMGPMGTVPLSESLISGQYETLRVFIEEKYFMTDQFLSADGTSTILIAGLEIDADAGSVIDSLNGIADASTLDISLAGNEVIKDTIWGYLLRILFILPPCAVILIITVFYLVLRNRRLTVLSIIPAGLAALWTFGTLFWSGQELNLISVLSPMFIIVIGSAYGLHFVSHYLDNMESYPDKRELIAATMEMVGTPILLATLTTMAGFISLVWTDITAMRQMGIFVTLGIGYAGFMALFFVPAVLSRLNLGAKAPNTVHSRLNGFVLGAARFRYVIPAVFAVVLIVSAVFIPQLKVESNQLMFFKESSEIRQTFTRVEETFGGAMPLTGEVINPKGAGALIDADFAGRVLAIEREMETLPGVKSVFSIFDMVKGVNKMTTGQDVYPADPMLIQQLAGQFGGTDLGTWVSFDGLRLMVRTQGMTSDDIAGLESFVEDNSDILRTVTGMPVLFSEMNSLVVKSQIQSLGLALVLIFIMLLVTLRHIKAALLGLLPIVITISAILGMVVITGFNLNLMTANLSAIAIGVGVDYSIHVISGIYYYRKQGMDPAVSVRETLSTVSRPVLANAFGLSIGFSAMFFSPLFIHVQAAAVMWVAMVVSSMAALLLVPLFYSWKRPEKTA